MIIATTRMSGSGQVRRIPVDFDKVTEFLKKLHFVAETGHGPLPETSVQPELSTTLVHRHVFGGWIEMSQPPER